METYHEMRERQQKEFNAFPIMFAFDKKQFTEGMEKLGLKPNDTDKIYALADTGGFYKKTDAPRLHEMFNRFHAELQAAFDADDTGEGFIADAFECELANHEYGLTHDAEPALDDLGLTAAQVKKDKRLQRGLLAAVKNLTGEDDVWI